MQEYFVYIVKGVLYLHKKYQWHGPVANSQFDKSKWNNYQQISTQNKLKTEYKTQYKWNKYKNPAQDNKYSDRQTDKQIEHDYICETSSWEDKKHRYNHID